MAHEEAVGSFSANIVGTEMNTGRPVVIENQYHTMDHDHFGKLSSIQLRRALASTIRVAENFRPEHKSVLEWLNKSGPKDVRFFGIYNAKSRHE